MTNALRVALLAGLLALATPAAAPAAVTAALAFPESVPVRESSVIASVGFTYSGTGKLVLSAIRLTPSCASATLPCTMPDPGVFATVGNGIGAGACGGRAFLASAPAPDGTVTLTAIPGDSHNPTIDPLEIPGGGTCTIALTLNVLKFPATDASVLTPGIQTVQHLEVVGTSAPESQMQVGSAMDQTTVSKRAPTLSTVAFGPERLGGDLGDIATLSGSASPGGTMSFALFGPDDADCSGPALLSSNVQVATDRTASPTFTPTAPGTYRWTASYSGDANHDPASHACNAPGESSVVGKAAPALRLGSPPAATAGAAIRGTAVLSGAFDPAGTITFRAYAAGDATCAGAPLATSTVAVTGNGGYASAPFAVPAAGTYGWRASYGGDTRNESAIASACSPAAPARPAAGSPPVLGSLSLSPGSFRAARSGPSVAARTGSRVAYTLSRSARVAFRVERAISGRRSGGRCVPARRTARKVRACVRHVPMGGSFSHDGQAGPNRFTFRGRLRGRRLRPGRYRLRAVARDASGRESDVRRRPFRIVR